MNQDENARRAEESRRDLERRQGVVRSPNPPQRQVPMNPPAYPGPSSPKPNPKKGN
jgi:hypothetical protein